jgi:hypothetical protein
VAKRKKAPPWDAVFDRVRVKYYADRKYPPKPTAAELNAVETQLGFQFPLSYRAFAERFGLCGWLCGGSESEIHPLISPEPSEPAFHRDSVVDATLRIRAYREHYERYRWQYPTMEFERLIGFGGGDDQSFMFYPPEITDKRQREYRIYSTCSSAGMEVVADSFPEWLDWADRYFAPIAAEEPIERYPIVFKPASSIPNAIPYCLTNEVGDKTAPSTSDVALWLAFNNHTARDLALAIRDHGRSDAFPILADALQEAGCTNTDLLDSCRTGDPDIDGKWVLRVLLGES